MFTLNENNIGKFNLISIFIILTTFAIVISVFSINSHIDDFNQLKNNFKKEFIKEKENDIKNKVKLVENLIKNQNATSIDNLKKTIKQRVDNSYKIIEKIYNEYRETKTNKEIIEIAKEILRPMRFDNGTGYIFMATLDGIDLLFPVLPQVENTNVYHLQDDKGNFVVQEEIAIVKRQQEGYIKDFWIKPNSTNINMIYPKITFVKEFKKLNLYIGTGMYIDDAKEKSKDYIKELVTQINKQDPLNYMTISQYNVRDKAKKSLTLLLHPSLSPGSVLTESDLGDLSELRLKGQTYLCYNYKNPITNMNDTKTTYLKLNKEWNWIIGTGFYTNEIDKEIDRWGKEQAKLIQKQIYTHIFLLILFGGLLFFIIYLINNFTQQVFDAYRDNVTQKKDALKKLNEELEDKIQTRTSELHELNTELTKLTNTDALTGAYNRRYFYSVSESLLALSKREKQSLSLAMIDIDNFKKINDTYGHDVGDNILKKLVQKINEEIRESDILIRFGGEEFVLLLPNTSIQKATIVMESIRKEVEQCILADKIYCTISIGISEYNSQDSNIDVSLKRADQGLYTIKNSGKNAVLAVFA